MTIKLSSSGARVELRPNLSISSPGWTGEVRLIDAPPPGTRAAATMTDVLPPAAFVGAEIITIDRVELSLTRDTVAGGTRSAGAASNPVLVLEQTRPDSDYALLEVDPDGVHRWIFPKRASPEDKAVFELGEPAAPDEAEPGKEADRGPIVSVIRKGARIVAWLSNRVIGAGAHKAYDLWEGKKRPHAIRQIAANGQSIDLDWRALSSGRALLLIHGTFSTPEGAFAGLYQSAAFERLVAHYGGRVFAFAHPSVSASIDENLSYFREVVPKDLSLDVDIVCHSRGGLVSRAIVAAAQAEELPMRVGKLVMVGAPNRGTPLADPEHWVSFIDRYTNVLVDLPDTESTIWGEAILCLVKVIGGGALGGLPGLDAMLASGETLRTLATSDLGSTQLYAIVADYRPASGSRLYNLLRRAGGGVVDALFEEPNDLVVPTTGCYDVTEAKCFPLAEERIHLTKDASVNHVTFFKSDEVRATLERMLLQE